MRASSRPSPEGAPVAVHVNLLRVPLADLRSEVLAGDPGCLLDPELFTGPCVFGDESPEDEAARVAVAREVCASCPVRLPCLAHTLRSRPEAGVWAGFTAEEIDALTVSPASAGAAVLEGVAA
jgi:WhiB family transcriptional regulator, redox-sensing transcriptional regulator